MRKRSQDRCQILAAAIVDDDNLVWSSGLADRATDRVGEKTPVFETGNYGDRGLRLGVQNNIKLASSGHVA